MKYVIAGGSGALGRRIADDVVRRGHEVVVLSRSPRAGGPHRQVAWDGRTVGPWAGELSGAVVVNLAGALVDRRPTAGNVELLRRSRVEPTSALVAASHETPTSPRLWLQMSTLAIYGDGGDEVIDEGHSPAEGPAQMAGVARPWEQAAAGARADRSVVLRTGLVLDPGSPALDRLVHLTRLGLGGRMGRGEQWVSWIHLTDFLAALRHIESEPELSGPVHVTSPTPLRNGEMMSTLRTAVGRRWAPPVPTPLVRAGAFLMGTDPALALVGRCCVPRRLLETGFEFAHPTFADAIGDLLHPTVSAEPVEVAR